MIMEVEQLRWSSGGGWAPAPGAGTRGLESRRLRDAALVLAFGSRDRLEAAYAELRAAYPEARIMGCSTAGEILGTSVTDDTVVATAVAFSSTTVRAARARVDGPSDSRAAGRALALELLGLDLTHVFVLSDGLQVNGSELAKGLLDKLPAGVAVTGGLAADGDEFKRTLAFLDAPPEAGLAAAVGFYGSRLRVGYGSVGGWDPFGVEWEVTRSRGNVLFELDGQSALELYKTFLGESAASLPASGLLFPLSVRVSGVARPVVRTLLAVDEEEGSLTFAGDVPEGAYARFMKANFDRLVEGAGHAARDSALVLGRPAPDLAVLISCVGRKLVLRQRVEEEVEAVAGVLGPGAALAGYYSYGELAPFFALAPCELHNQTMTVTTFAED
jgi:hypothetical protein